MTNRIQNRLAGTIIVVVLGTIILPKLFNGKKKHCQNEFIDILLIPELYTQNKLDAPPIFTTHSSSIQLPENANREGRNGNMTVVSPLKSSRLVNSSTNNFYPSTQFLTKLTPIEKLKLNSLHRKDSKQLANITETPLIKKIQKNKSISISKIYIVQLGALKNANKVNEIVNKLRNMRYYVYTLPNASGQSKVTRILVSLNASKDKLKSSLIDLKKISGLSGVVINYSAD